jgi:hypothetical protein
VSARLQIQIMNEAVRRRIGEPSLDVELNFGCGGLYRKSETS